MIRPNRNQPRDLWVQDGSFRDVFLRGAAPSDWHALIKVSTNYRIEYRLEGELQELPDLKTIFSDQNRSHLLAIFIDGVQLNCHFFDPNEIDIDIDPQAVTDDPTHDCIMLFLERLAIESCKEVLVTAENTPTSPYLCFSPVSKTWTIVEPQFSEKFL
jgi:hypothetical protein